MEKPYIVFLTEYEHGLGSLEPVYKIFEKDADVDATLISCRQPLNLERETRGLCGENFKLGPILVDRKPDVLVLFRNWWGPENDVGRMARSLNIPVVMIDHGMIMVVGPIRQAYRSSIFPATVGCLWSQLHLNMFRRVNSNDKLVVTGNPLYDQMIDYASPEIDVPDEFALLLTQRAQQGILGKSAEALNKIIPVVVKTHPTDDHKPYYRERFRVFDDYQAMLPLLYKAKIVIACLSSAWIPALFWEKPIFIHHDYSYYDENDLKFNEFKSNYSHIFNFKQDNVWNNDVIDNAIRPNKKHFEIFGHIPDGKNAERVAGVINDYIER